MGGNTTPQLRPLASLDVNVAPDARGSLRNKATVSSLTADPDIANNEAVATVMVQPPEKADLRLFKNLDSEEVLAGGTVRYSIRVTNAGPDAATRRHPARHSARRDVSSPAKLPGDAA